MVIFVSMNGVNNFVLQPSNVCAHHMKRTPVRQKIYLSHSILRERNYVQQIRTCELILIVLIRRVHRIQIRTL